MLSSPSTPNTQHTIEAPDGYDEAVRPERHPKKLFSIPIADLCCQDVGTRVVVRNYALWCPMEDSSQAL